MGTPQVKLVLERKEEGDAKVKAGHYAEALICYQGGVGAARTETFADEMQGGELGELLEATIACQLNLAHCCLKLCESGDVQPSHQEALLQEAINSCSFVLNHNPRDSSRVKALYRQGLCFSQLGRWHDAVAVLKSASDLVGGRDPKIEEALCAAVQQVS